MRVRCSATPTWPEWPYPSAQHRCGNPTRPAKTAPADRVGLPQRCCAEGYGHSGQVGVAEQRTLIHRTDPARGSWGPRATRGVGTMNEGPLLCHTNLARVALPLGAAPLW